MLNRLSSILTDYLVRKKVVNQSYAEVYTYGFMLLISTAFSSITVLLLSIIIADLFIGIIFLTVMMMMRFFCGGYHCSTYLNCWICTNVISATAFLIMRFIPRENLWFNACVLLLALASAVYIFVNSPIEHENNPQSKKQRNKNKKISRIMITTFAITILAGFIFVGESAKFIYFTAVTVAMLVVALLMITEKIMRRCSNEYS